MATIEANDLFTVIIEIEVDPERQDQLLTALADNIYKYLKRYPGFISSALHASNDGLRVINYAQWKSEDDWNNFRLSHDEGQTEREDILSAVMRKRLACARFGLPASFSRMMRLGPNKQIMCVRFTLRTPSCVGHRIFERWAAHESAS